MVPKHGFPIGQIFGKVLFWSLIVFILFYTLFPFYWAIVSSLTLNTSSSTRRRLIGRARSTGATTSTCFATTISSARCETRAFVSVGTVLIALVFGSFAAYALGRMKFRGRTAILYIVLSMTMFPSVAILGSLFLMIRGDWFLHTPNLYNTRIALVITYLIVHLALHRLGDDAVLQGDAG